MLIQDQMEDVKQLLALWSLADQLMALIAQLLHQQLFVLL